MSAKPLPEDVFVTRWYDRVRVIKTPEEALTFVHYMRDVADKITVGLKTDEDPPPSTNGGDDRFRGFPLEAKHGGRCVVCGRGFIAGTQILWQRESKQAAHAACGEARR